MVYFMVGLVVGGMIGVFVMCLAAVAKQAGRCGNG